MPLFAEGLDLHGKRCIIVEIIESLFEESHVNQAQLHLSPRKWYRMC